MDWCGPIWAYWAFPMERFCGELKMAIKSRRFPYSAIDNHLVAVAQLTQIKLRYNCVQELSLRQPMTTACLPKSAHIPSSPKCMSRCFHISLDPIDIV
jgi:hypothetical protein